MEDVERMSKTAAAKNVDGHFTGHPPSQQPVGLEELKRKFD
jgi:hypothetical protein